MLLNQHVVTGSKQNQPDHESDDRACDTVPSVCVLPMRKIWHFSSKFDKHLSLYFGAVKPTLQTDRNIGSCESLVRYDFQNLLTI